jgi:hypothetical protein
MKDSRVDLTALLEEKFEAWEQARLVPGAASREKSADTVLQEFLKMHDRNWIQFVGGTAPGGSIQSFRWAYDDEVGWSEYEATLAELNADEISMLTFSELVNGLPP